VHVAVAGMHVQGDEQHGSSSTSFVRGIDPARTASKARPSKICIKRLATLGFP